MVLTCFPQKTQAAQYCAFEVTVISPAGKPVSPASVSVVAAGGQHLSSAITDALGIARLCDAPAGAVDLEVGGMQCGGVTVHGVTRYWMKTRSVRVVYENCSGEVWAPADGCRLTVRVTDAEGKPIEGANLARSDTTGESSQVTETSDAFGRIFCFVKFGTTMTGVVTKRGFAAREITQRCDPGKSVERDVPVQLGRR